MTRDEQYELEKLGIVEVVRFRGRLAGTDIWVNLGDEEQMSALRTRAKERPGRPWFTMRRDEKESL